MRREKRLAHLGAAALAGLGLAAYAPAATKTWTNTLGNSFWDQLSNWSPAGIPVSADAAVFPTPGPGSKIVLLPNAGTMAAQSLAFNESYTLNSGALTLFGAGGPVSVAAGKTATINSVLGSNVGLTLSGAGTLVLNGNNSTSFTGGQDGRVNAGTTLRISTDANLGALFKTWTTGTLEVDGTFTTTRRFEPNNGTIRITTGNTLTLAANDQLGFSSTDTWTKEGEGTLKVTHQSSRFGVTFLNAGTIRIESTIGGFPQLGYGPIYVGAATLELGQNVSGFSPIRLGDGSTLRGVGTVTSGNPIYAATGGNISATLAGGASSSDLFTLTLSSTFGGTIGSTITTSGAGTVKLTGNTNYPGAWSVPGGKLRVAAPNALGTGSSTVSVTGTGRLILDNITLNRPILLGNDAGLQGAGNAVAAGAIQVDVGGNTSLGVLGSSDVLTIGSGLTGGPSASLRVQSATGGTVVLSAPTAYQGSWWVATGTLRVLNGASLGTGTTPVRISHPTSTLEGRNGITIARDITFEAGTVAGGPGGANFTGTISVVSGANVTFAGGLSLGNGPNDLTGGGSGAVIHVANLGTTTLTQSSDVAADWVIDNSTLAVSDDAQLGAAANTVALNHNAATFRTTAGVNSTRDLVFNAGTFDTGAFDSSFGNVTGASGTVTKIGTGSLTVNRIRSGGLNVSAGTMMLMPDSSNGATSTLQSLAVTPPARLDLTDNKLVVRATAVGTWDGSVYTDLTGLIASGRNGGEWDGAGIVTSMTEASVGNRTSIGIATAAQVKSMAATETALWGGQTVTGSDTLLMYTWDGDANLDGKVNIDDYTRIDSNILLGSSGWYNGDFNFDGKLNIDDYTIIDGSIMNQGPAFDTLPGLHGSWASAVPEPAAGGVLTFSLLMLARGRRGRTEANWRCSD